VLSDVNLDFPQGKITAVVGTSGSGKTTIIKLLQKVHDSYDGDIMIGHENLRDISSYFWRSVSGSVMPDGYIFSDTIARNIALGEETPDRERLLEACRVANILSFIESIPQGFNTEIGAEGSGLSTGQKQRILIARAVYKNPAFIFFDEATNALDAENEKAIMENLQEFFKGRTVVIVAHRLSTVKNADKILVVENGHIIEDGNHSALSSKRGKYYELVRNQLELGG
jgi:ATP-binding cassette subfamily B protein